MSALELWSERSILVIVDMQERLAQAMPSPLGDQAIANAGRLLLGATVLGVPTVVTEQYPQGLGRTVQRLRESVDHFSAIEKTEFNCCANTDFARGVASLAPRRQIVLCGMEAHICVYQTARGLVRDGFDVAVALDATCSRSPENRRIAEGLLKDAGCLVSSTETVLFDWLKGAGHDGFKAISQLVR